MDRSRAEVNEADDAMIGLPPGFRFHPTDEEIVTHYLTPKVLNRSFTASAIGEADLNKSEPWDLPKKAKMGEKEWFFFFQRDRKYPTGMRTNRATESGYWKATGKDREIFRPPSGELVGMKKTLVFYKGRAPKGEKTNWVMHEFRLEGKFSYYNMSLPSKEEWVVCRIFHKNIGTQRSPIAHHGLNPFVNELFDGPPCLPPLMNPSTPNLDPDKPGSSFSTDLSYFSHDQSEILQRGEDYKNALVSPYNYNFDTNTYQAIPFVSDHQYVNRNLTHLTHGSITDYEDKENVVRQCKVEQYIQMTNQSDRISVTMSHDTGVSNDMITTEISSASMLPKHGLGKRVYDPDDHVDSSAFPELDSLLEY